MYVYTHTWGCPREVIVKAMDYGNAVSEFQRRVA